MMKFAIAAVLAAMLAGCGADTFHHTVFDGYCETNVPYYQPCGPQS